MPTPNKVLISNLDDLIEVCKDGEQGYKDAADDVKDEVLKEQLTKYSVQRSRFMNQLNEIVKKLGGEAEYRGSILGILHRRWMDVRFAVGGSNSELILKECLRGEKSAMNKYEDVLSHPGLPDDIRQIIQNQFNAINKASEEMSLTLTSLHPQTNI